VPKISNNDVTLEPGSVNIKQQSYYDINLQ
jgi:hypothetical protein